MGTLVTVLLTILVAANIFIISLITINLKGFKERSSRMGGMVLLAILVVDTLSLIGGAAL